MLACSEIQKVAFATYMLKSDAKFWWKGAKSLMESDQREITWFSLNAGTSLLHYELNLLSNDV